MFSRRELLLALTTGATLAVALAPASHAIVLDRAVLDADGRSTAHARAVATSLFGLPTFDLHARAIAWDISTAERLGVTPLVAGDGAIVFRAGQHPGALELTLGAARARLELRNNPGDLDEDGLPDAAELLSREDRAAFTAWFTGIAEAQATTLDDAWPAIHRDCAGLVRFAYREALKTHDRAWREKRRFLPSIAAPDVRALRYPELPFIGELPFRAIGGRFDPDQPIEEQFSAAATAPALYSYNTAFVSRDLHEARAGDLLFFSVPYAAGSRMHTMIVLGARPGGTGEELGARLVYHTGARAADAGEVRLVSFDELLAHPDPYWHPVADNARFLGVHRLALVTHDPVSLRALR